MLLGATITDANFLFSKMNIEEHFRSQKRTRARRPADAGCSDGTPPLSPSGASASPRRARLRPSTVPATTRAREDRVPVCLDALSHPLRRPVRLAVVPLRRLRRRQRVRRSGVDRRLRRVGEPSAVRSRRCESTACLPGRRWLSEVFLQQASAVRPERTRGTGSEATDTQGHRDDKESTRDGDRGPEDGERPEQAPVPASTTIHRVSTTVHGRMHTL